MGTLRRFGSIAGIAVACASVPAAAPASNDQPVALKGINTVAGSASGTVPVHLDTEAELTSLHKVPVGTISASGRAGGFALAAIDPEHSEGRFVIRNRMSWCGDPGCAPKDRIACGCDWFETASKGFRFRSIVDPDGNVDIRVVLPPGDYLLYLVADDSPTSVTFKLFQPHTSVPLAGETSIPVEPKSGAVEIFAETDPDRGSGYWTSGRNITAGADRAFWFAGAWELTRESKENVFGPFALCDYPGGITATSAPCPATPEYWMHQGFPRWRVLSPFGVTVATTRDEVAAGQTYGISTASILAGTGPIDRGFVVVELH